MIVDIRISGLKVSTLCLWQREETSKTFNGDVKTTYTRLATNSKLRRKYIDFVQPYCTTHLRGSEQKTDRHRSSRDAVPIYIGFGGLGVACRPLVPKFAGSNPAEAVRFFRAKKILNTPPFGGEVKPSVPCRRFVACKRSLNLSGSRNLGKITGQILAHISTFRY